MLGPIGAPYVLYMTHDWSEVVNVNGCIERPAIVTYTFTEENWLMGDWVMDY